MTAREMYAELIDDDQPMLGSEVANWLTDMSLKFRKETGIKATVPDYGYQLLSWIESQIKEV